MHLVVVKGWLAGHVPERVASSIPPVLDDPRVARILYL
jgi:hypothetical protein